MVRVYKKAVRTPQYTLLPKGLLTILIARNFSEIIWLELSVKLHNSGGWLRNLLSPYSSSSYFLFLCYPNFIRPSPVVPFLHTFFLFYLQFQNFPKMFVCVGHLFHFSLCVHTTKLSNSFIKQGRSSEYDASFFESEDTLPYSLRRLFCPQMRQSNPFHILTLYLRSF